MFDDDHEKKEEIKESINQEEEKINEEKEKNTSKKTHIRRNTTKISVRTRLFNNNTQESEGMEFEELG